VPVGVLLQHITQPPHESVLNLREVIAAIESLYQDELRPYGRLLRKRLTERARSSRGFGRFGSHACRHLRAVCESCPWLSVQDEDGGDWSALIRGRPSVFIDFHSPEDRYPAELWRAAAGFIAGLAATGESLPGGRYGCAQALVSKQLPFLAGRSLGQLCHIVQLAISEKKMLGYSNGTLVPYCHSLSKVKEQCAQGQQPFADNSEAGCVHATWASLRSCLEQVVDAFQPNDPPIPLANLKSVVRSQFSLELSETVLGYAKLSELLQDSRVSDLCSVRLSPLGYVVLPQRSIRLAQHLAEDHPEVDEKQLQIPAASHKYIRQGASLQLADISPSAHTSLPTPSCQGSLTCSTRAESGDVGFLCPPTPSPWSATARKHHQRAIALQLDDISPSACASFPTPGGQGSLTCSTRAERRDVGFVCPPTPSPWSPCQAPDPLPTLLTSRTKMKGLPRSLCNSAPWQGESTEAKMSRAKSAPVSKAALSGLERIDAVAEQDSEPLPAAVSSVEFAAMQAEGRSAQQMLTPSTLADMGFTVQNTFINGTAPPPSPCGVRPLIRSASMPGGLDNLG